MIKRFSKNLLLPLLLLTGGFIVLDVVADRFVGGGPDLDFPHLILAAAVLVISFVAMSRAVESRRRTEAALRQAHDELEIRVRERTAELERTNETLRQVTERYELTQAAAGVGSWDWDIPSGHLEWSPKMYDLFGLDMRTAAASFDVWRSVVHPEDIKAAETQIDQALETHSEHLDEYRIIRNDGQIRWIGALGRGIYDEQGRPTRMSGICLDITDRKRAEAKIEHLSSFPQMNPNPVLEIDPSGAIAYCNSAAAEMLEREGMEDDYRALLPADVAVILQALAEKKEVGFQREVQVGSAAFTEMIQVLPAFNTVRIYAYEITKRKRAEEALRLTKLQAETEKRHLEAVLQSLPVGVVITDAQGGVLLTNGMDEQIWGSRPITRGVDDYVQYKAWWADSGKPVEPHEWASAQAVQRGESVFGQVLEIQRFDGGRGFILNSAVPIRDGQGRVIGSAVAIQDITELRRAEQALRESEERFRTVIDNSRDGINMLDLKAGRYIFMSPAQVALTGFSAEELRDLSAEEANERTHPDDREISISQQKEITAGREQGTTVEYRWKVKSGEYRWFSDSRKVVRDEQGRAIALVGVSRDITDQKRAEEALRASEEKYRLLFRNLAEGFALYELLYDEQSQPADWRVLEVNDAYTRHTGVARERIVGRRISDIFPAAIPEYLPRFAAVVATQTAADFETYAKSVDRHQHVVTFPSGGHRFASIIEDITERKRAEQDLRDALTETQRRQAEITALFAGSRAVLEQRTFESAAQRIFDICRTSLGATAGYIARISEDGALNQPVVLDAGDQSCPIDRSLTMPFHGLGEQACRTGQVVYKNEFASSEWVHLLPEDHALLDNVLVAPLTIEGKVAGLLSLANKAGGFGEHDAHLAAAFAELAAIALVNSRAVVSLEHSEERFRSVVQADNDAIIIYDSASKIVFWNLAAERIFGYSAAEMTGQPLVRILPGHIRQAFEDNMLHALATGKSAMIGQTIESVGLRKNGAELAAEVSLTNWKTREGLFFTANVRDISERKRSEEKLRQAQTELALGIEARAALEERQRLARELHDSVSQALYGISLGANTALTLFDVDRTKVLEALNYVLSLTQTALSEMRALIFELRPESLETEGLATALTKQARALADRHGIEVVLGLCDEPDMPLVVKEALYRIAQEALQNAIKHARPDRLDVRLVCEDDSLSLEVCDNGVGFDTQALYEGHLGLRSMRERATKVGGTLTISSVPDCGTQIRARVPLRAWQITEWQP